MSGYLDLGYSVVKRIGFEAKNAVFRVMKVLVEN
jgi:hypothetical protein